ncbi:MAG TPA: hypothetical protein VMZ92_01180, partial [Planctomycetota bacterium]|nr:hypothetical protein [Planctomycetota bacterium]
MECGIAPVCRARFFVALLLRMTGLILFAHGCRVWHNAPERDRARREGEGMNIILVIIDTLRYDAIGVNGSD